VGVAGGDEVVVGENANQAQPAVLEEEEEVVVVVVVANSLATENSLPGATPLKPDPLVLVSHSQVPPPHTTEPLALPGGNPIISNKVPKPPVCIPSSNLALFPHLSPRGGIQPQPISIPLQIIAPHPPPPKPITPLSKLLDNELKIPGGKYVIRGKVVDFMPLSISKMIRAICESCQSR
jgi:hypothetical protein